MKFLPNFKATFLIIGFTYMVLAVGLISKGLIPSMADFKIPQLVLDSPHYYDAILWVYVHMIVIGLLLLVIGYSVNDLTNQKWTSILLFLITAFYMYLDFRSADWVLGNALYKGEASLAPAIIGLLTNLLFLQLGIRLLIKK